MTTHLRSALPLPCPYHGDYKWDSTLNAAVAPPQPSAAGAAGFPVVQDKITALVNLHSKKNLHAKCTAQ